MAKDPKGTEEKDAPAPDGGGPPSGRGEYANVAGIFHSQNEFVFDFYFQSPGGKELASRVITNPRHAKAFLMALQENIAKYEAQFGKLTVAGPEDTATFTAGLGPH